MLDLGKSVCANLLHHFSKSQGSLGKDVWSQFSDKLIRSYYFGKYRNEELLHLEFSLVGSDE